MFGKKLLFGLLDGSIGTDFVKQFDADGDGKVSRKEILNAPLQKWIKFFVSTGWTVLGSMTLNGCFN